MALYDEPVPIDELSVKPVPDAVHERETEVAFVELQEIVNGDPAVRFAADGFTVSVGAGVGLPVVMVCETVLVPPGPVAVQVQLDG